MKLKTEMVCRELVGIIEKMLYEMDKVRSFRVLQRTCFNGNPKGEGRFAYLSSISQLGSSRAGMEIVPCHQPSRSSRPKADALDGSK